MKTAVIGDPHLSDVARDLYRDHLFRDLPGMLKKLKVTHTIILGDLTDAKDRHSGRLVNMIVQHVMALQLLGPVDVLMGNHDYENPDQPFFGFLDYLPDVTYHSKPERTKLPGVGNVQWLPHTYDYKRDWKNIKFHKSDLCIAHNTFQGADLGHKLADDGIPTNVLPHDRVLCGDVHQPQKIDNVTYVGAPYTVDFGDEYTPRLMLIHEGAVKSRPLDMSAQKILIEAKSYDDLPKAAKAAGAHHGDIVKIRIAVKARTMDEWGQLSEDARAWARKQGYIVHAVQPRIQEADSGKKQIQIKGRDRRSDKDAVTDYADRNAVNDRTLQMGVVLIK